jgi:hypothetical protein
MDSAIMEIGVNTYIKIINKNIPNKITMWPGVTANNQTVPNHQKNQNLQTHLKNSLIITQLIKDFKFFVKWVCKCLNCTNILNLGFWVLKNQQF